MIENISTIVIAASAVVTAGATLVLAFITRRYVRLTNEILKATNKPEVILFLNLNSAASTMLHVQNIGTGYASDVTFTGDLSFKPTVPGDKSLKETEPFKSGIKYLGPGQKIESLLFILEHAGSVPVHSFTIGVSYRDSANTLHKNSFRFDIGNWMSNSRQFIHPQTDEIEHTLKNINQNLRQIRDKMPSNNTPNNQ